MFKNHVGTTKTELSRDDTPQEKEEGEAENDSPVVKISDDRVFTISGLVPD